MPATSAHLLGLSDNLEWKLLRQVRMQREAWGERRCLQSPGPQQAGLSLGLGPGGGVQLCGVRGAASSLCEGRWGWGRWREPGLDHMWPGEGGGAGEEASLRWA